LRRAAIIALLLVAAVPLLAAVAELPEIGATDTPAYTHVVPRYLEEGAEEAGGPNIVTDVILNYRGFDTNGEVTVIFTALAGVMAVLAARTVEEDEGSAEPTMSVSPVLAFVVRLIAPFIVLFSIFLVMHGHLTPGGGFQGGAILGSLVIVVSLVLGRRQAARLLPPGIRTWLHAAAVLAFFVVGLSGLVWLGSYLEFPRAEDYELVRELAMLVLEAGIAVGGGAIVASLFWRMEGRA
jgi:multicomponent Na+:H+ antiporter subunit B